MFPLLLRHPIAFLAVGNFGPVIIIGYFTSVYLFSSLGTSLSSSSTHIAGKRKEKETQRYPNQDIWVYYDQNSTRASVFYSGQFERTRSLAIS